MLGCHDFCGYYEWTFHYLRRRYGREGVEKYWAKAIAADSQRHYIDAAADRGLRGLYESWLKTGDDEECDWTVTLDEDRNLLRLDMRECPSKGFLLKNNLNADEDYCDHCMGWIGQALTTIGVEVARHEHNHCGQCWWEIREAKRDQPDCEVETDIRNDSRWERGYLHRYSHHEKQPLLADGPAVDSCEILREWFRDADTLIVLSPADQLNREGFAECDSSKAMVVSGACYAAADIATDYVRGVIIEHRADLLPALARRFRAAKDRPLLLHPYLPSQPMLRFHEHGLPRPVPLLPLLIRTGIYDHHAWKTPPEPHVFATMLAAALQKRLVFQNYADNDRAQTY